MGNHIGFLAGIVTTTEVPGVLLWDCRKTDWFHAPAWPALLTFNPHPDAREITVETGPSPVVVFDLVSGEEIHASVTGLQRVRLPGDTARVLVMHPAGAPRESRDGILHAAGAVVGGSIGGERIPNPPP